MKTRLIPRAIITIVVMLICITGYTQTKVFSFNYDGSGNRENRQLIQLKSGQTSSEESIYEDIVNQLEIKIYPNPTKGLLKIEIPCIEKEKATIGIFTMQGAMIKKLAVSTTYTEVDLKNQPPGIYILRICVGEISSEWKIIKD
jgi:hypothetical protein